MALVGNNLYIANTDALVRFPYQEGNSNYSQWNQSIGLTGWCFKPPLDQNVIANREGKSSTLLSVLTVMLLKMV